MAFDARAVSVGLAPLLLGSTPARGLLPDPSNFPFCALRLPTSAAWAHHPPSKRAWHCRVPACCRLMSPCGGKQIAGGASGRCRAIQRIVVKRAGSFLTGRYRPVRTVCTTRGVFRGNGLRAMAWCLHVRLRLVILPDLVAIRSTPCVTTAPMSGLHRRHPVFVRQVHGSRVDGAPGGRIAGRREDGQLASPMRQA